MLQVFLDTSALIYLVEGQGKARNAISRFFEGLDEEGIDYRLVVSRIAHLECRIAPIREGDEALLKRYDSVLSLPRFKCVELTQEVVELATMIRAKVGLKTPDALQAASALQLGENHWFVTGDKSFLKLPQLKVVLVSP